MQNILQLQKALEELSAKAPTPPFAADQNIYSTANMKPSPSPCDSVVLEKCSVPLRLCNFLLEIGSNCLVQDLLLLFFPPVSLVLGLHGTFKDA